MANKQIQMKVKNFTVNRLWMVALTVGLIAAGALLAWGSVRRADQAMRHDLLRQTRLMAETINLDRVKALTGTEVDLESPVYLRLKEQLAAAMKSNDKYRFIYLLGRKPSGEVFFFVDNEPAGSENESPAGQLYQEAPEAFLRIFQTGRADMEGPFTDRWGTFVSAAVPIVDPGTHSLVAVLVVDIDASNWYRDAALAAVPSVLLTLAMISILFTGAALLARRARMAASSPGWMRHLEPALAVATGLTLTLFAAWTFHQGEQKDHQIAFIGLAESRTLAVAEALHNLFNSELEALARFYESSEHVEPDEFYEFTTFLKKNPAIHASEWIPAVPAADKERFEAQARSAGLNDFTVWQEDAQGNRVPASGRDVYYPVFLIAPLAGNEKALGFDLGSEPVRGAGLETARSTGLPTATDPITLVQETASQKGMLVYRPIFNSNRPDLQEGFVLVVLRMKTLLENTNPYKSGTTEIALLRPDGTRELLAATGPAERSQTGHVVTHPVFALGKIFVVTSYAGDKFLQIHPDRVFGLVLVTGLLLTAALAFMLSLVLQRRTKLEREVEERTRELSKTRNQLSDAVLLAHLGPWEYDAIGDLFTFNDAFYEMLRTTAEEVGGYTMSSAEYTRRFVHPKDVHVVGREIREALETDDPNFNRHIDHRVIYADGEVGYISVVIFITKDETGRTVSIYGVNQDITESKRAEEELRVHKDSLEKTVAERTEELKKANKELTQLIETANAPIFGVDTDGNINEWNQMVARITGYGKDEVEGRNLVKEYINEEYKGSVKEVLDNALKGEETDNYEVPLFSKGGERIMVLLNATSRRDAEGSIVGVVGVGQDITELREHHENLERLVESRTNELNTALKDTEHARDRTDGILKSVADGLIVTDVHNRVILMNRASEDLLSIRLSEVVDRPIDFAIKEETLREKVKQTLNRKTTGYLFDFKLPGDDPKHPRIMRARTSVILDREGKDSGIVTTIYDVTHEREVDRMKTEFISTAAHELRTPLTSIQGFSEILLMREDLKPEEREKFLTYINKQSVGLAAIINDLLDISRIESGRGFSLNKVPCNAGETIQQIIPYFQEHYTDHQFEVALPEKPVKLNVDKEKMGQVLKNLLSNAAKYSPEGGTICVTAKRISDFGFGNSELTDAEKDSAIRNPQSAIEISVADQGMGMTPEQVDKIFDKFYRADASNSAIEGTGLGMTVVKHIVEAHGGEVWVESELGKGTTVTFTIPV